ncbi:hypothetical protein RMN57_15755 [Kitasatospora sp. CM 4170]|uniref:Secreted protein n=1 Tax=Kitasatospora aburaviensis TaxID=67265 RepID=A0ABW1F681_9ACTN|nr:hypothetical protein [Kitasatospora sp. CM 4170]WNM46054.1 hypothetical protein RMN57_15755 [Kitasatospora sp. CM 4170]
MTGHEHPDLTEQLVTLADEPAPAAGYDTARAMARGQALLRRRRRTAIGAVAAATALVVGGTLLLAPAGSTAPAPPAVAPTVTVSATASPSATPTRSGVDPLTTEVRFGWLPDWVGGNSGIGYETGYHGIFAEARGRGERAPRMLLSLYPAGPEPEVEQNPDGTREKAAAPPVNGQPAHWVVDHSPGHGSDFRLRWQTPSGRWAQLWAYGGQQGDVTQEIVLRVAAGAEYGKWNVPLPVRFAPLPEAFKATDVSLWKPPSSEAQLPWQLWLMFQFEGKNVSVGVEPIGPGPSPSPTGTDGSPYTDPNPSACREEKQVRVCVGVGAGIAPSLEQIGGLEGLLARTEVLGADESTWTTDVLN